MAEGALVAALDPDTLEADLEARGGGAGGQAELEDVDIAAESALEDAQAVQLWAEAERASARAAERQARIALDDARIGAPSEALVLATDLAVRQLAGRSASSSIAPTWSGSRSTVR